jgi:hypothetical protein
MIEFGRGMLFPDSWLYGEPPGHNVDIVECPECGEDRWAVNEPCEHCGNEWNQEED